MCVCVSDVSVCGCEHTRACLCMTSSRQWCSLFRTLALLERSKLRTTGCGKHSRRHGPKSRLCGTTFNSDFNTLQNRSPESDPAQGWRTTSGAETFLRGRAGPCSKRLPLACTQTQYTSPNVLSLVFHTFWLIS